jgi:hypothetical protein
MVFDDDQCQSSRRPRKCDRSKSEICSSRPNFSDPPSGSSTNHIASSMKVSTHDPELHELLTLDQCVRTHLPNLQSVRCFLSGPAGAAAAGNTSAHHRLGTSNHQQVRFERVLTFHLSCRFPLQCLLIRILSLNELATLSIIRFKISSSTTPHRVGWLSWLLVLQ